MAFSKHAESASARRILRPACGAEDSESVSAMSRMSPRFPSDSASSGSTKTIATRRNASATKLAKVVKAILAADGATTERKLDLALVWTARSVRYLFDKALFLKRSLVGSSKSSNICPANNWFWIHCPTCNCSGHSKCDRKNQNVCLNCAQENTAGANCERCAVSKMFPSLF